VNPQVCGTNILVRRTTTQAGLFTIRVCTFVLQGRENTFRVRLSDSPHCPLRAVTLRSKMAATMNDVGRVPSRGEHPFIRPVWAPGLQHKPKDVV
jgi:hypothetical protein